MLFRSLLGVGRKSWYIYVNNAYIRMFLNKYCVYPKQLQLHECFPYYDILMYRKIKIGHRGKTKVNLGITLISVNMQRNNNNYNKKTIGNARLGE